MTTPAEELRAARRRAGLTQAEVARRTGVAQANIAAYESGRRHPSPTMRARLLAATRVRPSEVLDGYRDDVREIVRRHHGLDVRVFGSVARGEDSPDSDVDLLVRFDDAVTLFDIADMTAELEELLGCRVDIVDEAALWEAAGSAPAEAAAL
ncbi:MAG: nucleotidyltransferase domain-containing protein [Actinomycetota bacterium]